MFKPIIAVFNRLPLINFFLLLLASLLLREYYSFYLSSDIAAQLQTLGNFMHGHGISFTGTDKTGQLEYYKCSLWPAGFVIFLVPFYLVTKSVVVSAILLKLVAYIFFVVFIARYLKLLQVSTPKKKLVVLFLCISIAPFIHFFPSDLLATVFCLWGFYYNLKYQENEKFFYLISGLFFIALGFFVKYSIFPFLLYPTLAFVLKEGFGIFKRFKQLLMIAFFSSAAFIITYVINRLLVGRIATQSVYDAFNGMAHWNHLSRLDGFLFTVGYYEIILEEKGRPWMGFDFQFNWVSLMATAYFYYLFVKNFFSYESKPTIPAFQNSLNISLSAGALIVGFLSFLSINNAGQTWMKPYWTFVEETRYYGPVIVVGLINALIILTNSTKLIAGHFIIVILLLLSLSAHVFLVNGYWKRDYQNYKKIENYIQSVIKAEPKLPVVVYDSSTVISEAYYYLRSQGTLLIDKNKYPDFKFDSSRFSTYLLKLDSVGKIYLGKVQP